MPLYNVSAQAYHGLAVAYFATLTTQPTVAQKRKISDFCQALTDAGLEDELVDACLLRAGQNEITSTSIKTLKGGTGTLAGTVTPSLGRDGMSLSGTGTTTAIQRAAFTVTSTPAFTLFCEYTGVAAGQPNAIASPFSMVTAAGYNTATGALPYWNGAASGLEIVTIQTPSVGSTSATTARSSNAAVGNDPDRHVFAVSNSNAASPALVLYQNGEAVLSDSSGNIKTTSAMDTIILGCRYNETSSYNLGAAGIYGSWFLFNRVLTAAEVLSVSRAIRVLDQRSENIVAIGDSTSCFIKAKATDNWPYQISRLPDFSNALLINAARNGWTIASLNSAYAQDVQPHRPDGVHVTRASAFVWAGINDVLAGTSAATIYTNLKTMWADLRVDGFRVYVATLMDGNYTAPQETVRLALNVLILSDPTLYDGCFRRDLLLPDYLNTFYFLDNYHLQTAGNTLIAADIQLGGALASRHTRSPMSLPDAATIATDAATADVFAVTLTDNRTLGNPTNPSDGARRVWWIKQDGTGSRTLTLDTKFAAGPWTVTLSTAAAAVDCLEAVYDIISDKWRVVNFQKGY